MQEIYDQGKIKQAAFAYLSSKVNPMNVKGIHAALVALDPSGSGELPTDQFVKCLSSADMKFLPGEVDKLIATIKVEKKMEAVAYTDFLKYTYLYKIYIHHHVVEEDLRALDPENKGLITVDQLDNLIK